MATFNSMPTMPTGGPPQPDMMGMHHHAPQMGIDPFDPDALNFDDALL